MRTLPQREPVRRARILLEKAGGDDVGTLSAALTHQTLLSLVPVILLAASILGFVFAGDEARADAWIDEIAGAVPGLEDAVGRSIESLVNARLQAGIVAVAVLAWTGSAMAGTGAHALARIFDVKERPWYRQRPMALVELAVLGVATLGAVGLTSLVQARFSFGIGLLGLALSTLIDIGLFLLVYVVLTPPGGPPWRAHVPGAVVMGLAWVVLKLAGGWYVDVVVARASAVYGAIGAVIGLLAILSLAARAFLYGAELSAVSWAGWPKEGGPSDDAARRSDGSRDVR